MTKLVTAILLTSVIARAQPSAPVAAPPQVDDATGSYRLELAESELPSIALAISGVALGRTDRGERHAAAALLVAAGVTYAFGGAAVHLWHGHPGRAALSVGLRGVMPVLGAGIGLLGARNSEGLGAIGPVLLGTVIGAVVGNSIDIAALGGGDERPNRRTVTPVVAPTTTATGATAMTFGFAGAF